jgi:hypothetical protein
MTWFRISCHKFYWQCQIPLSIILYIYKSINNLSNDPLDHCQFVNSVLLANEKTGIGIASNFQLWTYSVLNPLEQRNLQGKSAKICNKLEENPPRKNYEHCTEHRAALILKNHFYCIWHFPCKPEQLFLNLQEALQILQSDSLLAPS